MLGRFSGHVRHNAVAYVALFFALGGTAAAAAAPVFKGDPAGGDLTGTYPNPTVASSAVNGAKVADNSLTGADILEASLGKVPSATSADDAGKLDGIDSSAFMQGTARFLKGFGAVGANPANTAVVLNEPGLVEVFVTCSTSSHTALVSVQNRSSSNSTVWTDDGSSDPALATLAPFEGAAASEFPQGGADRVTFHGVGPGGSAGRYTVTVWASFDASDLCIGHAEGIATTDGS